MRCKTRRLNDVLPLAAVFWAVVLLLLVKPSVSDCPSEGQCSVPERQDLEPTSAAVGVAVETALAQLQKMSESGVYETLNVAHIISAQSVVGRFHRNIILSVGLRSDFKIVNCEDGNAEIFETEFVVMHDMDTGEAVSVAVDRLPEFEESTVAEFQRRRVEKERAFREEEFQRLEQSYLTSLHESLGLLPSSDEYRAMLAALPARTLRDLRSFDDDESKSLPQLKVLIEEELDSRFDRLAKAENV